MRRGSISFFPIFSFLRKKFVYTNIVINDIYFLMQVVLDNISIKSIKIVHTMQIHELYFILALLKSHTSKELRIREKRVIDDAAQLFE